MIPLKYNTASQEIPLGYFVDSTDGNTAETGLSIANTDIQLWKAGATSLVNKNSGGATHISNGIYYCTLNATDTNTYGALKIFVHVSGALAVCVECVVMNADAYDALYSASAGNIRSDAYTVVTNGTYGNAAIETLVDELESRLTAARAGYLDNLNIGETVPTQAQINTQVDTALTDIHLDHLLAVDYDPASKPGTATALLNELVENDGGVSRFTENALEQAPSGTGASASVIADAVWDEALSGHTAAGSAGEAQNRLDDIQTDTEDIQTQIGTDGAGLTNIPWNSSWDAEVQSEVQDAIEANHLDHLLAADYDPTNKPGVATALLNEMVESDGGVSRFTANSLEQAPTGGSAPTAVQIRQEMDTNSTQLSAIVTDTNEIQTKLPTNNIMGSSDADNHDGDIDAILVDTNEIQSKLPTNNIMGSSDKDDHDTDILAILADTNELQGDWTNGGRLDNLLDALGVDLTTIEGKINTIDSIVDAILDDTGSSGVVVETASKTGYELSAIGIDAIHDEVVESTITLRQAVRLILSGLTCVSSGGGSNTISYRDIANGKNRLSFNVDANNNRTVVVTRDGT